MKEGRIRRMPPDLSDAGGYMIMIESEAITENVKVKDVAFSTDLSANA
jgi:hypothetical protein